MSNKIFLKKSSVVGRVPAVGDLEYGELALNYTDGKLYFKTSLNTISSLGGNQNFTQIDRQSYTATAGQTIFAVAYGIPYVDVYINGIHLSDEDYVATTGSSVTLLEACAVGDQVDVVGYSGGLISVNAKVNGDVLVYNGTTLTWDNVQPSTLTVGNASKWVSQRTLSFVGDATGSMAVDGSTNVSAALTLANSGVVAGSYGTASAVPVITIDSKGRITSASTTAVAGVSGVSYNTVSGVLSIDTSAGTTFTADLNAGTGDSPTFASLTTTGNAVIGGNLTVNGTTTTLNSTSLSIDDVNITLADGAANAAAANGAGITVAGALATLTYTSADDRWNLNKNLNVTNVYGALIGNASTATTLQTARTIGLNGDIQGSVSFNGSADALITATIQPNSVALGTDTTGNYMLDVSPGAGITISHTPGEGSIATISHTDTSSQASVDNSGNTFIQDITLDTFGHITGLVSGTVTVGDGILTVQAGAGLIGSGTFTANQTTPGTITLSHADTSSQASVDNTGNTFIQDLVFDTYGHVTGATSASVTVGDGAMTVVAGIDLAAGGQLGTANQIGTSSVTLNHANITRTDTNSVASPARNGNFTVVDSLTTNARGHVTAVNVKTVTLPDFEIVSITKSLTLTPTWQNTGISTTDLATGSYMIQLENFTDYSVGGGHYFEYYTGVMSWYSGGTNAIQSDEIFLHRAGHAPNSGIIFLRTLRNLAGVLNLQISCTTTNSGPIACNFKFRRMI